MKEMRICLQCGKKYPAEQTTCLDCQYPLKDITQPGRIRRRLLIGGGIAGVGAMVLGGYIWYENLPNTFWLFGPPKSTDKHPEVFWSPSLRYVALMYHDLALVQILDSQTQKTISWLGSGKQRTQFGSPWLSWSPDETQIAMPTGNEQADNQIEVWDISNGNRRAIYTYSSRLLDVDAIAWSPDSSRIAFATDDDPAVVTWLAGNGTLLASLPEFTSAPTIGQEQLTLPYSPVTGLSWAPDNKRLALTGSLGTEDGYSWRVIIWDSAAGSALSSISNPTKPLYQGPDYTIKWSPDGSRIALGTTGALWILDPHSLQALFPLIENEQIDSWEFAWSPDGSLLAVVSETFPSHGSGPDVPGNHIEVWRIADRTHLQTFTAAGSVAAFGWSAGGRSLQAATSGNLHVSSWTLS